VLNTAPQDVVTGINPVATSGLKILYTLTSGLGPTEGSVNVLFTLMDE
jgi:hypothetical protein